MIGSDELEDDKDESSAENDESFEIMVLFVSDRKYSSAANRYFIRLYSDTKEVDPPNIMPRFTLDAVVSLRHLSSLIADSKNSQKSVHNYIFFSNSRVGTSGTEP